MSCFFLICLCEGIPVFSVSIDIGVSSYKWFLFIDANDTYYFCPLISDISFLISFDDCRFYVIVVIDSIGHLKVIVVVEYNVSRGQHIIFVTHGSG